MRTISLTRDGKGQCYHVTIVIIIIIIIIVIIIIIIILFFGAGFGMIFK